MLTSLGVRKRIFLFQLDRGFYEVLETRVPRNFYSIISRELRNSERQISRPPVQWIYLYISK
jgi:hypothetical protein